MAVKSKIIVFIVIVGICLLAQSFDTYMGTSNLGKDVDLQQLSD